MKQYFIGIDPGKTGAIAVIEDNGDAYVFDMGIDGLAVLAGLKDQLCICSAIAVMESVVAFSPAGRKQGGTGMINYGEAAGEVKGWLQALQIPQDKDVSPSRWKKDMRLTVPKPKLEKEPKLPDGEKEDEKLKKSREKKNKNLLAKWEAAKKEGSMSLARRLFPTVALEKLTRKKDHNRAEALLIAEWLRRRFMFKEPDYSDL